MSDSTNATSPVADTTTTGVSNSGVAPDTPAAGTKATPAVPEPPAAPEKSDTAPAAAQLERAAAAAYNDRESRTRSRWQRKLLPFMMWSLGVVAVIFFVGTFVIYASLTKAMTHSAPPISAAIAEAREISKDGAFADWYVRATLEERSLSGRQRQYNVLLQSRLWTRLMGFLAGMVTLLAGAVFILGRLETEFDGRASGGGHGDWSLKTNSPGLVLVVAGVVLMTVALTITSKVNSEDQLVYMPVFSQAAARPEGPIGSDSLAPGASNGRQVPFKPDEFDCSNAKPTPPECPKKE